MYWAEWKGMAGKCGINCGMNNNDAAGKSEWLTAQ